MHGNNNSYMRRLYNPLKPWNTTVDNQSVDTCKKIIFNNDEKNSIKSEEK